MFKKNNSAVHSYFLSHIYFFGLFCRFRFSFIITFKLTKTVDVARLKYNRKIKHTLYAKEKSSVLCALFNLLLK